MPSHFTAAWQRRSCACLGPPPHSRCIRGRAGSHTVGVRRGNPNRTWGPQGGGTTAKTEERDSLAQRELRVTLGPAEPRSPTQAAQRACLCTTAGSRCHKIKIPLNLCSIFKVAFTPFKVKTPASPSTLSGEASSAYPPINHQISHLQTRDAPESTSNTNDSPTWLHS